MFKLVPLVAIAAAALLAGCASTGSTAVADAASSPSAAPATTTPTCLDQAEAWRDSGAVAQFRAIGQDSGTISSASYDLITAISDNADQTDAEADMQSAAAFLTGDVSASQANLPPTYIPNLRRDESAALADYDKAAADCQNAISEMGSESYNIATADLLASAKAENAGNTKLGKAVQGRRRVRCQSGIALGMSPPAFILRL